MKSVFLTLLCFALFGCHHSKVSTKGSVPEFTGKKYFDIKSCKLVYKFTDGFKYGEKTVVFDDWGNIGKIYVVTHVDTALLASQLNKMPGAGTNPFLSEYRNRVMNQPEETRELTIKNAKETIVINLDTKEAEKQSASLPVTEAYTIGDKPLTGHENIVGLSCSVVMADAIEKVWIWSNVALKKEHIRNEKGLKVEEYAVKVVPDYAVKVDEFNMPQGVTVK